VIGPEVRDATERIEQSDVGVVPHRYGPTVVARDVPRIRRTPLPDNALLVVRGDELDQRILRADATRFRRRFAAWNRYGVSALIARDDIEVASFCETRLE
jgi:hypothetical protein